jgi:hypothetical protein
MNSSITDGISRLSTINSRVSKLFKNPQINFLLIMLLVLLITCYSLLSDSIKSSITYIMSNPSITVICIIFILAIGYYDIAIASLMLILFFIIIFGWVGKNNYTEGFENNIDKTTDDTNNGDKVDGIDKHIRKITSNLEKNKRNLKTKAEKDKKLDEQVNNIKDVVLGTITKFQQSNDNDYKKALLENKQTMFKEEIDNNERNASIPRDNQSSSNNRKQRKRENFQTIEIRALDPSNEQDTNLLITKEILQDMLNRIEYNYESNKYLRKYIKHRIEEIIEINKLADDE